MLSEIDIEMLKHMDDGQLFCPLMKCVCVEEQCGMWACTEIGDYANVGCGIPVIAKALSSMSDNLTNVIGEIDKDNEQIATIMTQEHMWGKP